MIWETTLRTRSSTSPPFSTSGPLSTSREGSMTRLRLAAAIPISVAASTMARRADSFPA